MFQNMVRRFNGYGVPGELVFAGPKRVMPGVIMSADPTQNIVGRFFTGLAAGGPFQAGGTGQLGGILVNPKVYASVGIVGDPLAPSMLLPNNTLGEFLEMGFPLLQTEAAQAAAPQIGDILQYNETTGAIVTVPFGTAPAAGYAAVPNAVVYYLPQTVAGAAQPYIAKVTN